MAKITRTNPDGIAKPFFAHSHVVTAEGAQKLVFCAGQWRSTPAATCCRRTISTRRPRW